MAAAKERGAAYNAQIVTNGYLLTQDIAGMLGRCGVTLAQVTIDGIGAIHDATRRLTGGGATFERIAANLRNLRLPFVVAIRTNVHEGNLSQVDDLRALAERIAQESGNNVTFYAKPVLPSVAAEERCGQVELLSGLDAVNLGLRNDRQRIPIGDDHQCAAITLWAALVDAQGSLHSCAGLTAADPSSAYGTARDWDPSDPIATASAPDNLTAYLNCASPTQDDECHECVWLPLCGGGCPHYRLQGSRICLPFRDDPQRYVLSRRAHIADRRRHHTQDGTYGEAGN